MVVIHIQLQFENEILTDLPSHLVHTTSREKLGLLKKT